LIIGLGIAGATLSRVLLQHGYQVHVVDEAAATNASKVAAGLFNPITGRKLVKTWMADQLFPELHQFYQAWQQALQSRFFMPERIYVPFDSQEKQNDWLAKSADPAYQPYIAKFDRGAAYEKYLRGNFGGMLIEQSGHVEIPALLSAHKQLLQAKGAYSAAKFHEKELIQQAGGIRWRDVVARKVIFCNGAAATKSTLWGWLPFRPVKGELLEVTFEDWPIRHIVNRGCWVLPWQNGRYKVGATYENRYTDTLPSEKGREQVEEKLRALVKVPYRVHQHWAGIRPATYDRRPFVGLHPFAPKMAIFNGLGAKGVSLAPYMAKQLLGTLMGKQGKPMAEVLPERVFKKWPQLAEKAKKSVQRIPG